MRPTARRRRRPNLLYSVESLEPRLLLAIPHIGSADASPNPIAPGGALTLTAHDVTGVPDDLEFYMETNGTGGLQTTDTLVDGGALVGAGTYAATDPAPATPGTYTFYAVAHNDIGQRSNVVSFQATVEMPPVITGFIDTIDPVLSGRPFNLVASANDPDGVGGTGTVNVYRESNDVAGLQTGAGGDLFISAMGSAAPGQYNLQVSTLGLFPVQYTYYAVATDSLGGDSSVASVTNIVDDPFEPNDTLPRAHDLGTAGVVLLPNQTFHSDTDEDFFKFTAPRTTTMQMSFSPDLFTQRIAVFLYGASGNFITSDAVEPSQANHVFVAPVTGGQSYFMYMYEIGTSPGPYNFVFDYTPTVVALTDSPDPQVPDQPVRLTLAGNADEDHDHAFFYRESNGIAGLQEGSDTLIGQDTYDPDGLSLVAPTIGLGPGIYTYYAYAVDSVGVRSDVLSTTNTVQTIPGDPFEPNDSFEAAADLGTLGSRLENNLSIHVSGNDDYYRFSAASNFDATVNILFQNAQGDLGLAVYDANRNLVSQVNSTADGESIFFSGTGGQSYYVKVYGVNGALNPDYSLFITVNGKPSIASLSDSPDPQYAGGTVRLTANGVLDPDGNLGGARFYRESNGIPGLQLGQGADTSVGLDTTPQDGFTCDVSTGGLSPTTYLYYALAVDAADAISNVVTTSNTLINDQPPRVLTLADTPDPLLNSSTITLTAGGVNDPDGDLVGVRFYRESTGDEILETGPGGDILLGTDTDPAGGYTITAAVAGLPPGYYFYYAQAYDAAGIVGNFWATALNRVPLPGDANLDDKVDFNDLVVLAQNYNGTGKTYAQGDFNFDTKVDFADLVLLAQNYNGVIVPPPPRAPVPLSAPVASLPSSQSTTERKAIFSTIPVARPKPVATPRPRVTHKHLV